MRLTSLGDSYVKATEPSANFGATRSLASQGSSRYVSYLRFAIPKAPKGKRLAKAVLRLHTSAGTSAGSASRHEVRLTRSRWSAKTVTWESRPMLARSALGRFERASAASTYYSTSLRLAPMRTLRPGNRTLAITSWGTDALWFASRNNADVASRPQLILTYR